MAIEMFVTRAEEYKDIIECFYFKKGVKELSIVTKSNDICDEGFIIKDKKKIWYHSYNLLFYNKKGNLITLPYDNILFIAESLGECEKYV